jgi:hypothetical protein
MFNTNSRYAMQTQVAVNGMAPADRPERQITAITLRRLPPTNGEPLEVKSIHRLDLIAQEKYSDPLRFWHIADANTDLDARQLRRTTGRTILVPET